MVRGNEKETKLKMGLGPFDNSSKFKDFLRLMNLLDILKMKPGITTDEILAILDEAEQKGKDSEARCARCLRGHPLILNVRPANRQEDIYLGIDIVAKLDSEKIPWVNFLSKGGLVRIQVKSSWTGVKNYLGLQVNVGEAEIRAACCVLAEQGRMVIKSGITWVNDGNGHQREQTEREVEAEIRAQFENQLRLMQEVCVDKT